VFYLAILYFAVVTDQCEGSDGCVFYDGWKRVFAEKIDLDLTEKMMGETVAMRLMSALGDVTLDYGEGA